MLKLSLIIPVYNEERHIERCLEAISRQTIRPHEVIVVDNKCSDRTVELAKKFDFVRVVAEPKQGRAWARARGFNSATGDILGRIDADSIIDRDWVERVLGHFEADANLSGLTGLARTSSLPFTTRLKSTFWARVYYGFVNGLFRVQTMWGATMAVRRSDWLAARDKLADFDENRHEDQELSLVLAGLGAKIQRFDDVKITTGGQTYRFLPKLYAYLRMDYYTYFQHRQAGLYQNPDLKILPLNRVLPGMVLSGVFGSLLFIFGDALLYPVDRLMISLVGAQNWLKNQSN